jgi:arginase
MSVSQSVARAPERSHTPAGASGLDGLASLEREALGAGGFLIADVVEIQGVDESRPEIARTLELIRRLSRTVRAAVDDGALPLIVAGSCNSSLGTVAGVGAADLGVVWMDAHADFDDPEENISGYFDVMGLAMLTGRGWSGLRSTIPGHEPVPERNVVLAAVRDLDPYQRARMQRSELLVVGDDVDESGFDEALSELASRASRVYLHIDLDCLDVSVGRAISCGPGAPPRLPASDVHHIGAVIEERVHLARLGDPAQRLRASVEEAQL